MKSFLPCICCFFLLSALSGQSVYTEFGKNRIQYHDDFDNWWMYETENFVTYWYGKGRNIGHTVVKLAELDNDEIQNILEFRFNDKIEIIVYVDKTDLHQSNIGAEDVFSSHTGTTKILGNKIFVYYDGNHQNLRNQIREGIAGVYLESMLYGSNLQEIVQNAVLLNLPEWFKEGLVSYLGSPWNKEVDDQLRDLFQSGKKRYRDFRKLSAEHPKIAGHAMWYYLAESYGKSTISNLLYLTRINRNLENAFLYVLGISYKDLIENWSQYFDQKYSKEAIQLYSYDMEQQLDIRNKRDFNYTELALSPDGKQLAYVLNDLGKARIYLYDTETQKQAKIFKNGIRNKLQDPETNYPLLSWSPDGDILAILYEKRDVAYLTQIDFSSGSSFTEPLSPEYQRVYNMDHWSRDTIIFTAAENGLSDLWAYFPRTRESLRITDDYFDDLDANVEEVNGKRYIFFSSNRINSSLVKQPLDSLLPIDNFDIFALDWQKGASSVTNLTGSPKSNDRQPLLLQDGSLVYLADASGIWNRKIIQDPLTPGSKSSYVSNYNRNILLQEGNARVPTIYQFSVIDMKPRLFALPISSLEGVSAVNVGNPAAREDLVELMPEPEQIKTVKGAEDVVDPRYLFQSEFEGPDIDRPSKEGEKDLAEPDEKPKEDFNFLQLPETGKAVTYNPSELVEFSFSRALAHRLRFKLHNVQTTMDNSLLFSSLDSYAATKMEYENPPLGILLKAEVKDLFEDYIFEGGARFPTSFNGSEYFVYFSDLKKRIDKTYGVYRKTTIESAPGDAFGRGKEQLVTSIGQVQLKYAFDIYTSLRATGTLRNDRLIRLATDANSLRTPIRDDQRVGLKLEYIYDNTLEQEINFLNGTRYKVWVEVMKKFDLNLFESGDKITFDEGFMTVLGLDARHYQPLDKHSIFALRLMGSTSFGSEGILYYLGGVENWLFSSFDNTIPLPSERDFAYQTIAAQMRGFKYNARNGSSVALINAELRVPLLRYFFAKRIKSSLFRNFQLVGFFDVGTAWHGKDPFSKENPLNTLVLTNPPTVTVEVKYFRNPVVMGYGGGVRTTLFGYFVKLDYAWGYETKRHKDPILYFSIGTDF